MVPFPYRIRHMLIPNRRTDTYKAHQLRHISCEWFLLFFVRQMKSADFGSEEDPSFKKGNNMTSFITTTAVLAIIFLPAALDLYFNSSNTADQADEEYIPDGR